MSNDKENPFAISAFNFSSQHGGKDAITRMLQAYGFSTRQALCDHLGVSQSTMANRWMRDTFPHDWLIACHLDTGASMLWLTTGQGEPAKERSEEHGLTLRLREITNGLITDSVHVRFDSCLMPKNTTAPFFVRFESSLYLADEFNGEINDGVWLIEIDGFASVRQIYRLPGSRLKIENGPASFECAAYEVKALGKVVSKIEQYV